VRYGTLRPHQRLFVAWWLGQNIVDGRVCTAQVSILIGIDIAHIANRIERNCTEIVQLNGVLEELLISLELDRLSDAHHLLSAIGDNTRPACAQDVVM